MRWLYNLGYKFFRMPWDTDKPRKELVELVEKKLVKPGRTLDLGCGNGINAIYLAQHGFDVSGIDFALEAIEKAKANAKEAGVDAHFYVDDLTKFDRVKGKFDFLLDFGSFDDLPIKHRDAYIANVRQVTKKGSRLFLWCFEWEARWWEHFWFFRRSALRPGEVEELFGDVWDIEKIGGAQWPGQFMRGYAAYLMKRSVD